MGSATDIRPEISVFYPKRPEVKLATPTETDTPAAFHRCARTDIFVRQQFLATLYGVQREGSIKGLQRQIALTLS
ncbi:hypothetical protein OO012_07650 [Rhodobacteraceae bacterium KMM 6894]|nr:hypothetical protein [Rhodobacteraceae bacterium KMM 6894]